VAGIVDLNQGGGASLRNVNGTLPVDISAALKPWYWMPSIRPADGGMFFSRVSGNSLNYLRTGTNPAIHLNLKWERGPTNAPGT